MGRFLTADDEELLRSFRPHVLSYVPSYLLAFLWTAWAAAGWAVERLVGGGWGFWLGYATFILLILCHGYARYRWGRQGRALALHAAATAFVVGAAVLDRMQVLLPGGLTEYDPLAAGAALTALSLVAREMKRHANVSFLTTQRVVARHGLAPRTETVLFLKDIAGMETRQGLLGSLFGFGRIRLVKGKRRRSRTTKKGTEEVEEDDVIELVGVPHFEVARRDLNSLLQETRLSDKERRKRHEERRLKESMDRVARWDPPSRT